MGGVRLDICSLTVRDRWFSMQITAFINPLSSVPEVTVPPRSVLLASAMF